MRGNHPPNSSQYSQIDFWKHSSQVFIVPGNLLNKYIAPLTFSWRCKQNTKDSGTRSSSCSDRSISIWSPLSPRSIINCNVSLSEPMQTLKLSKRKLLWRRSYLQECIICKIEVRELTNASIQAVTPVPHEAMTERSREMPVTREFSCDKCDNFVMQHKVTNYVIERRVFLNHNSSTMNKLPV